MGPHPQSHAGTTRGEIRHPRYHQSDYSALNNIGDVPLAHNDDIEYETLPSLTFIFQESTQVIQSQGHLTSQI